jgi:flagellar hook assembly protein FlgD
VHTVPDPYYVTSGLEVTPAQKIVKFVNLPNQVIIRIYSVSGILVDIIEHNDQGLGGEATWDVRNRNNQFVASGVYFYHVETPSGEEKIGRMTIVNSKNIAITAN